MKLIVNADDFGMSKALNLGIAEAFNNGIVTSTTIMANKDAFEHAVWISKDIKNINVGVHLTLTSGKPILKNLKTLVDSNGNFLKISELYKNIENIDTLEIKEELNAQINKVIESGIEISHLDSHQHAHNIFKVGKIISCLAKNLDIPTRLFFHSNVFVEELRDVRSTEAFESRFYDEGVSQSNLIEFLNSYKDETVELMTHPAYIDQELIDSTSYWLKRAMELKILCSDETKKFINEKKIELISFKDLGSSN